MHTGTTGWHQVQKWANLSPRGHREIWIRKSVRLVDSAYVSDTEQCKFLHTIERMEQLAIKWKKMLFHNLRPYLHSMENPTVGDLQVFHGLEATGIFIRSDYYNRKDLTVFVLAFHRYGAGDHRAGARGVRMRRYFHIKFIDRSARLETIDGAKTRG